MGNGALYHGDAIQLMRSLPNDCIDMVVTDPPYPTISGGKNSALGYGYRASVLKENDGKIFKHNDVPIIDYMREFARLLKPASHCYVMINNLNLRELLNVGDEVGLSMHNLLVWDKRTATANRWYMKNLEYTVFFYKKPAKTINNCGSKQLFNFLNPRDKSHPTEKPVELMQHYIENSSNPGELILDPFAGHGASLVAAQRTGRRWMGMEIDPVYYYPAVGRLWQECNL